MAAVKVLLPIAWTAWGLSVLALLYVLFRVATERTHSPEAGRGLGVAVFLLLLLLAATAGLALHWASRRESLGGVVAITALLVFPGVVGIAGKAVGVFEGWRLDQELAKPGDFPDAQLKPLAEAIDAGDAASLTERLTNRAVPKGTDRDGSDLLIYAVRRFRFDHGSLACVQVLLRAGADPNTIDPHSGWPPLMDLGEFPDAVRAFVEAGADIEVFGDGIPPVVRFTGLRQWESALYLVEKGARLDTATPEGLSLDYYVKDWRDSVFGEHPEGWNRLRAAIAQRRPK